MQRLPSALAVPGLYHACTALTLGTHLCPLYQCKHCLLCQVFGPLCAVAMSGAADSLASVDGFTTAPLEIEIDNDLEPEYTLIRVEGRGQGNALLAALSSGLQQFGVNVNSAAQESEEGKVLNVFKVTTTDGKKVPQVWQLLLHRSSVV